MVELYISEAGHIVRRYAPDPNSNNDGDLSAPVVTVVDKWPPQILEAGTVEYEITLHIEDA